jgi:hypothetical protein
LMTQEFGQSYLDYRKRTYPLFPLLRLSA